jgi:membrane protein DedA with SNARE-associated domain
MLQFLIEWITKVILSIGYPGIAFLMMLESMIFPLPSEAVLPFAGYLVSLGKLNIWWVALAATVGSMIGSWIGYEIGRYGGKPFLRRWGKYFLLNDTHLEWTDEWFKKHGEKTIFFSRLIPVVRHFISIPAGMTKMDKTRFFAYTFAGAFVWNLFLTYVGVLLGEQWTRIEHYTQPIEIVIAIIIACFIAWFVFKQIEKRTLEKRVGAKGQKAAEKAKD